MRMPPATTGRLLALLILLSQKLGYALEPGNPPPVYENQKPSLPDPRSFEPPLRGLLEEAVAAVTREPAKAEAWGRLAVICHAHSLRAEARHAYGEAAKLAPASVRWPHLLGILCDQLSLPDEAATAFSRALELDPRDIVALCSLARIREERDQDDGARKLYLEAIRVDPGCIAARVGLGRLAMRAGVLDVAEKSLLLALEALPRCGPTHAALAEVHALQGHSDQVAFHHRWAQVGLGRLPLADPLLEEVENLGVSYEVHLERGQLLGRLGRWREAVARFRAAVELKSDLSEARYWLGMSLIQAGEVDAGVSELEKATGMKGREVDSWIHIARARAGRGDLTGAHAAIEAALKLAPRNAEALVERGELLRREKKLDLALADFERAIASEPGNAGAHLARGQALLNPGATRGEAAADPAIARREMARSQAALAAFSRALELKADLAEAYEGAGSACMQEWDYARGSTEKAARVQAAIQHFEHAVRYFPERMNGHLSLIKALHEGGKVEESVAAMRRARKRWPADPRFQKRSPPAEDRDGDG